LWASRIRLPRFAERAAALAPRIDVERIADAWLEWAEEPDGWFAFIHGEVVARKALDQHHQVVAVDDGATDL
jgi:hypothetical protein